MSSNATVSYRQAALENGIDLSGLSADLAGTSTSGAATYRPERWNAYSSGEGGYQYQIAAGDTLSALAALYLDDAARWAEIWNLQPSSRTANGSPDEIYADEWMEMPKEAGDNARAWNGGTLPGTAGGQSGGGGGGGGGGSGATGETDLGTGTGQPMSKNTKTAIVVVVAALAALGIVYAVTR
jgi:hypothetical protein